MQNLPRQRLQVSKNNRLKWHKLNKLVAILTFIASLSCASLTSAFASDHQAGTATVVYQQAFADNRKLEVDSRLHIGETLVTKDNARLHARMIDDTVLMLGENAHFKIDELTFDTSSSKASFKILSGAFRMVSGKIAKQPNNQVTLTTPIATIGIRGTDFWGIVKDDSLSIALLDDSELVILLPSGLVTLNNPMTLLQYQLGDQRPTLTTLSQEVLAEAVKTIELPD